MFLVNVLFRFCQDSDKLFNAGLFLSLTQLCSVVVIALILLVLLFIAPLFFHLPKVRKTIANEINPSRHSQPKIEVLLSPLIGFGAKLNDVTE